MTIRDVHRMFFSEWHYQEVHTKGYLERISDVRNMSFRALLEEMYYIDIYTWSHQKMKAMNWNAMELEYMIEFYRQFDARIRMKMADDFVDRTRAMANLANVGLLNLLLELLVAPESVTVGGIISALEAL